MSPLLQAEKSGELLFTETTRLMPEINKQFRHYTYTGIFGGINMHLHSGKHVQVELTHFNPATSDTLLFPAPHFPFVLTAIFLGSCRMYIPGKKGVDFHDRGFNLQYAPEGYKIKFEKKHELLLVTLRYSPEFIRDKLDLQPLANTFFSPGSKDHPFYFKKNAIVAKDVMMILSQLIFFESAQGYDDFFIEQVAGTLFGFVTENPSLLLHQPLSLSLEEARWFYVQKNKLLPLTHYVLPFGMLMAKAGIKNVRRFRNRMRQLYGISIQQFIMESRIASSIPLLKETDLPLKDIAGQTGFKTVTYFSKVFRNYFGETPGSFRTKSGS